MTVWSELVGQERSVAILRRAVDGARRGVGGAAARGSAHSMSHAWLITGPPGSGRSNAARAFAAALQCSAPAEGERAGCGSCRDCRTALSGAHPDVTIVRTELLSIGVDEVRELARRSVMSPTIGRHQVIVVEDADRVTERGADALLKSVEEPAPATVWILCAPTPDDVVVTIRSRCRLLTLQTPGESAIAELLSSRDGVAPDVAEQAARASQGHIGRARALARSADQRSRRREVLEIPFQLHGLGACLTAAARLVERCGEEASATTAELDRRELTDLQEALGFGAKGARPRQAQAALKELDDQQRARGKRLQRDALDRALTELTGLYRDVLSVQTRSGAAMINPELGEPIAALAASGTPERTLRRIDALLGCREALELNVAPLLAVEAALIGLVEA